MELAIIGVRTAAETDGSMAPAPGPVAGGIAFEPADGADVQYAVATALQIDIEHNGKREQVLRVGEIRATIFVTDSRIAFAVANYDKGGGWVGTGGLMLALNAISKARASIRSRGLTLTGQVRYAWLEAIGGSEQSGHLDSEKLRISTKARVDGAVVRVYLDFALPKDVSSAAVAAATARRAARYRLAAGEGVADPDARAALEQLAETGTLASQKGQFALHRFPGCWAASTASVDLAGLIAAQAPAAHEESAASQSEPTLGDEPVAALLAIPDGVAPAPAPPRAPERGSAVESSMAPEPSEAPAPPPGPGLQPAPPDPAPPVPAWSARLDDGQELALTALTLFGRDPAGTPEDLDEHGSEGVTLIALADDTMTLSKTHIGVAVDEHGATVTDRHSTNGATVTTPTGDTTLVPGVPHRLQDGDTVRLGGRSFAVQAPIAPPQADDGGGADIDVTVERSQLPPPGPWLVRLDDGEQLELRTLNGFGRAPSAEPEEYKRYGYPHIRLVQLSGDVSMADNHAVITCDAGGPVLENRSHRSVSISGPGGDRHVGIGQSSALEAGDTVRLGGRSFTVAREEPFGSKTRPISQTRPPGAPATAGSGADAASQPAPAARSRGGGTWKRPALVAAGVFAVVLLIGNYIVDNRPTTLEQICSDYTDVWAASNNPTSSMYGNPVFSAVGDLAHSAGHYGGDDYDFAWDAEALQNIADSSTTSEFEIAAASQTIASACR